MPTHTRTKQRLSRHHVVAEPPSAIPDPQNRQREDAAHLDAIHAFVQRTTIDSGVPLLVEDPSTIDQIARVLA
jgi:hypothetical protein